MHEQLLSRVQGDVIALGPHKDFPQRTRYEYIRLRISDARETTLRDVIAAAAVNRFLAPGKPVVLYVVQSPAVEKFLFAIDADGQRADVIDSIGEDQARARKQAFKLVLIAIPLCLVLVGLVLLPLAIRAVILLGRAPKPEDMRAVLAAHPVALQDAPALVS
jgi:hypothetical protein